MNLFVNIKLETENLTLQTLDSSFAEKVLDYYINNRDFLEKWEPSRDEEFYTISHHIKDLEKETDEALEGRSLRLWIFKKEDEGLQKIIGNIGFSNIIRGVFQSCHVGYKIDKDETNKGYATEAMKKAIEFIFQEMKLHRLEANIIPENYPSIRVVEKLAFINEGISRKYLKINGKWQDHIHMVLLNEEIE